MASEHVHQTTAVNWFRENYPEHTIYAIPNGGKRSYNQGKKFRREGLLKGLPDLAIVGKDQLTAYVEMKKPGGTLRPEQKHVIQKFRDYGFDVMVCYGFEDFKKQIMELIK